MELDVLVLSRVQFALTVMFHYIFPPLSIGLGLVMVVLEGSFLITKKAVFETAARFWTKIFAVNFAVGVATGIVMEFQFGTNWAVYSRFVGDVFGSALAAEGIFAFFLESGFLALLVFGWDRVGPRTHFFATVMVFFGSTFSAVWIVIANSWQQTPAGYELAVHDGVVRAQVTDFWAMIFNPSSMHRLGHVVIGSFILGAFFVCSISAFYLLKDRHHGVAKASFKVGLVIAMVMTLAEAVSGHSQAVAVSENQPAKLAAFEGHFHTTDEPTELYIMGIPDVDAEEVKAGIAIPGMLSFLVHGDGTPIPGLDTIPEDERPPVVIPFVSYHVMVGLGFAMIGLAGLGVLMWWRGKLFDTRWLLWLFVAAVVAPYIANQTGWVAAEVGRQPWVVYGLLKTSDALSTNVVAEQVLSSIIMFSLIYVALFSLWVYVLNEKIKHGPEPVPERPKATFGSGTYLKTVGELGQGRGGRSLTEIEGEPEGEA